MTILMQICVVFLGLSSVFSAPAGSEFVDVCKSDNNEVPENGHPPNYWGTYKSTTKAQKKVFVDKIFEQIPKGTTACELPSDFQLNRHYENIQTPSKQIYSFYCAKGENRGYEHIEVDVTVGEELYIRWAQSLSELGIVGAKGYPSNEYSAEELEQKKRYIQPIFEAIKNDIPATLCPDPDLKVHFSLSEKDENYLHYWKFPVSCGVDAAEKIDVEVMQDQQYCYVEGGNIKLVFKSERPIGNSWEEEEEIIAETPSSELQSGVEMISFSTVAMTMIPLVFSLIF